MRRGMPSSPTMCIGKNSRFVPAKMIQKLICPGRSKYCLPVTFGNQKYMPPKIGKTAAPKMM